MRSTLAYTIAAATLALYSGFAMAGLAPPSIPEPGTMSLLVGGAAAFAIVQRWRNRK